MRRNNKALYEQIMRNVAKEVKRVLNEDHIDSILSEDDSELSLQELVEKIFRTYYPELLDQHAYFHYDENDAQLKNITFINKGKIYIKVRLNDPNIGVCDLAKKLAQMGIDRQIYETSDLIRRYLKQALSKKSKPDIYPFFYIIITQKRVSVQFWSAGQREWHEIIWSRTLNCSSDFEAALKIEKLFK